MSQVKGSSFYPSYPGRANFSYSSLQNLTNRSHEQQKVGSAGRVTSLARSASFDGRVTPLAGPSFLHIITLAHPAGSTRSRLDEQNMRGRLLIRAKGSLFFSYKRSLKLTRLRRVTLLPETTFLPQNRV